MSLGPVMLDLAGPCLDEGERELLKHPQVGGVILFSRNYQNPEQLRNLCKEIHDLREPPLLIGVDHEGGRVQRFREHFVHLPACARFGQYYRKNAKHSLELAHQAGWLLASELLALGVDFSFAPVLDLGRGISTVIDDRAFHASPEIVGRLGLAMTRGMQEAGMSAVGKHFPGHGSVVADSHHDVPVDERPLVDIEQEDLQPFAHLVRSGLRAVMPAHVIYPQVDAQPAGFSKIWLQGILRRQLGFQGMIFSDDLSMAGAAVAGTPAQRAKLALDAGCDMVLVCNDRGAALEVLKSLNGYLAPASQARFLQLHGRGHLDWEALHADPRWQSIRTALQGLEPAPELNLHDDQLQ